MNADEVLSSLNTGRSRVFDWLADNTPTETIANLLAAMGNTAGGRVVIGIFGQHGKILGVREPAVMIERVLQASLNITPPMILPLPKVVMVNEKSVIVVDIPEGMPGIYAINGRFLGRKEGQNTPLSPHDLHRLLIERGVMHFETNVPDGATLDDINWVKARAYANQVMGGTNADAEQLLLRRGCLARVKDVLKPTHAGILLFGNDPQRFIRNAEITAVRFAGNAMSDQFSRQDLTGTLPDQITRAETFLRDHMRKQVSLGKTMARNEAYEYPLEAARELLVNAVAHRDYSIIGDGVRLYLFANRLEVTSPGELPGPVTIDNIKDARFSRNPVIVQVLADMGFIERLGYGIDRVFALMAETQLPAPEFTEIAGVVRAKLQRAEIDSETPIPPALETVALLVEARYQGVSLNTRQEAAILFLTRDGNPRITNSNLQSLYPEVHPETIRRDLSDLVTKDLFEKHGQKRGSYYILKTESASLPIA